MGEEIDGGLVIDLTGRLPAARRSRNVDLELFERWRKTGPDRWESIEYSYELRHHELGSEFRVPGSELAKATSNPELETRNLKLETGDYAAF